MGGYSDYGGYGMGGYGMGGGYGGYGRGGVSSHIPVYSFWTLAIFWLTLLLLLCALDF